MSIARRLFTTSAVMFASRLFGAGLMFVTQAGIARLWGADSLGQYNVAVSAMNLAAVAVALGFPVVASYFAADYATRAQGSLLRRFFWQASAQAIGLGLLTLLLGPYVLKQFGTVSQDLAAHWAPVALTAIALCFLTLTSAIVIAFKRPLISVLGDAVSRPLILLASLGLAFWLAPQDKVQSLLWFSCIGTSLLALIFVFVGWRFIANVPAGETPAGEQRRWWFYAAPWAVLALAGDYFFDFDLLLLSRQMPYDELAVFAITTRLFALAAFGVTVIYSVALPDLFAAEIGGLRGDLLKRVQHTNIAAAVTAVAMLGGVLVVAPFVLWLMGPKFEQATWPLAILCLALLIRSIFGPGALVLSLAKRPYQPLIPMVIGLATVVIGNFTLVPLYGLYGATLSAALALGLWAAALWLLTLRLTGNDVSIFPVLMGRK